MTAVYAEALTFMAPRILDQVSVPQLTVWGLQGLTTLDPALRIGIRDLHLQLFRRDETVLDTPAPRDDTPTGLGEDRCPDYRRRLSSVGTAAAGRHAGDHPGLFR